jgi:hypothetical protein
MQRQIRYIKLFSLVSFLMTMSSFIVLEDADPENIYVIGNSSVKSSLSQTELHDILYSDKREWSEGKPIVIAVMDSQHPTFKLFAQDLYKLPSNQVSRIWLKAIMQKKAEVPVDFTSEEELLEFVIQTSGSIGFISKKTEPLNVKRIQIND